MKAFIALLTALLITALTAANPSVTAIDKNEIGILENFDVEGSWAGILKISSAKLRIVFNVSPQPADFYILSLRDLRM